MNRRFHEVARQQNNINIDRSFFNANTRQDKNWQQQRQKPKQQFDRTSVNLDRQMFNTCTNGQCYFDANQQIANRNFNNFEYANSMRNKQLYTSEISGQRIISHSDRTNKAPLKTDDSNFVKRIVNTNPYAKNVNIGTTRIQAIDTQNNDYNQYKQVASSTKKNKFNPFAIY